ncbi:NAD(P)-dependent dehydrogenase (short-subunit alcohol dehydrogenase family) [Pararhodobacter aggregans]|nr:NAD(P)-dependent dehydrogenase (short-subunit alcohol dehydrogenase family) [Pararhodobacter aggregans]
MAEAIMRSAIVTGAASGLGAATTARLRAEGFMVTGVDRAFAAGGDSDPGLHQAAADVADEAGAARIVDAHVARWGPPRVLVNCAGIAAPGATLRPEGPMPLDEFRHVLEVNVAGSFNYLRLVARAMQDAPADADGERGVIVNTSSIAAFDGMVGQAAYAASKGAVAAMTLPLARELGKFGIRVMAIAPGVFSTPMVNGMNSKSRDIVTAMRPPHPDRIGRPEEFADLVMTIVSQHYLNGHVIRLDGGLRMPPR